MVLVASLFTFESVCQQDKADLDSPREQDESMELGAWKYFLYVNPMLLYWLKDNKSFRIFFKRAVRMPID